MTTFEIKVNDEFGGLSTSMQKALAFMFTRHMVSHAGGDAPGELNIRVAHPDRPCADYEDMTSRVFSSSRVLDAMVKRELVAVELRRGGAYAVLTPRSFGLATQLMDALGHALLHGHVRKDAA